MWMAHLWFLTRGRKTKGLAHEDFAVSQVCPGDFWKHAPAIGIGRLSFWVFFGWGKSQHIGAGIPPYFSSSAWQGFGYCIFPGFFFRFPRFYNFSFEGPSKQASQPASQHASTHAKHATSKQANTQTHTDLNKQPKPIRNQPEPNLKKPQTLNHHSTPTIQSQNTLKTSLE